ncbi:hypothetical protein EUX98_g1949 [Antrodiella citrinella]|uniref:Uncharacterized protein n=1 Tax=Antrodiella citrinella TaxID=2447956 RepID=A0A4S4N078_9APHY|nr:hypothetical protein EUX98_g1949 [Antrodiella citrinella]
MIPSVIHHEPDNAESIVMSIVSAGRVSTTSVSTTYYSVKDSPMSVATNSLPGSPRVIEEEDEEPPTFVHPPISIIAATPRLPLADMFDEPESLHTSPTSESLLTPKAPNWQPSRGSLPPSPTFSTKSSVHFATTSPGTRPTRSRHLARAASTGSAQLLAIHPSGYRRKSISGSSNGSLSDVSGETDYPQTPASARQFVNPFMSSQVSTLGARTHVDEPEDVGQLPVEEQATRVPFDGERDEKKAKFRVVRAASEGAVEAIATQERVALAKGRRKNKFAGAARLIRRLSGWKDKSEVDVSVVVEPEPETVVVAQPLQPAAQAVTAVQAPATLSKKVHPVDDLNEPLAISRDEVADLMKEMAGLRAHLARVENHNRVLQADFEVLKSASRTSVETVTPVTESLTAQANSATEALVQELSDKVQRLEEALSRETDARKEELHGVYQLCRFTWIGR